MKRLLSFTAINLVILSSSLVTLNSAKASRVNIPAKYQRTWHGRGIHRILHLKLSSNKAQFEYDKRKFKLRYVNKKHGWYYTRAVNHDCQPIPFKINKGNVIINLANHYNVKLYK